jgi:hypothetical protein
MILTRSRFRLSRLGPLLVLLRGKTAAFPVDVSTCPSGAVSVEACDVVGLKGEMGGANLESVCSSAVRRRKTGKESAIEQKISLLAVLTNQVVHKRIVSHLQQNFFCCFADEGVSKDLLFRRESKRHKTLQ